MKKFAFIIPIIFISCSNIFSQTEIGTKAEEAIVSTKSREGGVTEIQFVGSGDIQKALSEGNDFSANTGVGVIFKRTWKEETKFVHDLEFDFTINVASTVDTIIAGYDANNDIINSRDFGSYLLLPTNSRQATKFLMNTYFHRDKFNLVPKFVRKLLQKKDDDILEADENKLYLSNIVDGLNFDFIASNRIWQQNESVRRSVTVMSGRIGLFHDFVPNSIRLDNTKEYSIRLGIAYTFRGIYGDSGFSSEDANLFRKSLLGSEQKLFHGREFFLGLRLRNIIAEAQIISLYGNDSDIPGLTGTQFVTSIRFVGGFPLVLNGKKKNDEDK